MMALIYPLFINIYLTHNAQRDNFLQIYYPISRKIPALYYYYRTTESAGSLDQQPLLLLLSALTENTNLLCSAIKIRCEFAYLHITTAALSALETCQDHNLISANYKITVPDITLVFFSGDDGGSGLIDRFGGHAPRIYRSARGAEQDWLEKRTGNWKSTTITAVARKNSIGTILANI